MLYLPSTGDTHLQRRQFALPLQSALGEPLDTDGDFLASLPLIIATQL